MPEFGEFFSFYDKLEWAVKTQTPRQPAQHSKTWSRTEHDLEQRLASSGRNAYRLAQSFTGLIRDRNDAALDDWLVTVAARSPRHRLSVSGVVGTPATATWRNRQLYADCRVHRATHSGTGGSAGLCCNRLAVAIPCHRVLRSDGELAGYRWGVERKRNLLAREAERITVGR